MRNRWRELGKLLRLLRDRKTTMRGRLMLYLVSLIFAALGIVLLMLAAIGGSLKTKQQIAQTMEQQLQSSYEKVSEELEEYTGYGLQLSRGLGQNLEYLLKEKGLTVSDLNDHPEELLEVQKMLYKELNTTIRLGRSSGAFAVVNATVNTQLPGAEQSKSGVYLRLINVSSNVVLTPETILFRGMSEVARENGLELHNRWNMEFQTDELPGSWMAAQKTEQEDYYWTQKSKLKNTWEDVILLMIPIRISTGEVCGVCGIELNEVHFNLEYPAESSSYGSAVTVLAPTDGKRLRLEKGMSGDRDGTWLKNSESLFRVKQKQYYSLYQSSDGEYYGVQKEMELPGEKGERWAAAILLPRQGCDQYIQKSRNYMMAAAVGFTVVMLILAGILSNSFVKPIVRDFEDIGEGMIAKEGKAYSIAELEELCKRLAKQKRPLEKGDLPPNIAELFAEFAENVKSLTRAEYHIFRYYLEGYEVSQIPGMAFLSMSTVKKHNGNIYRKLKVSSNDELTVYLDLFRRCGCLEQLQLGSIEQAEEIRGTGRAEEGELP